MIPHNQYFPAWMSTLIPRESPWGQLLRVWAKAVKEKTKGNLSGEEERLLSQVLYDLRLKYVEVSKRA